MQSDVVIKEYTIVHIINNPLKKYRTISFEMGSKIYHCIQCNKEFLEGELAKDHRSSTRHDIKQRILEK